ncbi:MAG: methionyl-tRNA formyltransferase, partial [Lachnospiraceae bacterium]|nr:methionyl-tRNA formyltransferase [Lachnospiraceae bacterium]
MRVVYMGTPDFAVNTLEAVVNAGHEVLMVVTQPDKEKGRGKKIMFTPVKEKALEYGLTVVQPKRVKEEKFIEELEKLNPDVIVVVAFGQLLPERILNIPQFGCINVHAALLPAYRGAA